MDDDPDERRQRFLERNRAAASRCRQKRKLWVNSLEKKAEELTSMNVSLTVSAVHVTFLNLGYATALKYHSEPNVGTNDPVMLKIIDYKEMII